MPVDNSVERVRTTLECLCTTAVDNSVESCGYVPVFVALPGLPCFLSLWMRIDLNRTLKVDGMSCECVEPWGKSSPIAPRVWRPHSDVDTARKSRYVHTIEYLPQARAEGLI